MKQYCPLLLNIMVLIVIPAVHAAAKDKSTQSKQVGLLTAASNDAYIEAIYTNGVTKKNTDFIHQRLDAGASVHPCASNGWNILHYLAISEVNNRTIFPLIQKVINKSMSGAGKDKNYKLRQTPDGKTAQQLAQTFVDANSHLKKMYQSRALFIRDFRTNELTTVALHRVLSLYNPNPIIAQEAQDEIKALENENPEEFALIEPYLHDKPDAPRVRAHKECMPIKDIPAQTAQIPARL